MASKKAQAGMEFLILIGFVMLAFAVFFLLIKQNMSEELEERNNMKLQEIGLTIRTEITLAAQSPNGYRRNFTLPQNIYGEDYTTTINQNVLQLSSGEHQISMSIYNTTGILKKGENNISKENGNININQ